MMDRDERIALQVQRIKQASIDSAMSAWRFNVLAFVRANDMNRYGMQLHYRNNPHLLRRDWGTDPEQWPHEVLMSDQTHSAIFRPPAPGENWH